MKHQAFSKTLTIRLIATAPPGEAMTRAMFGMDQDPLLRPRPVNEDHRPFIEPQQCLTTVNSLI